MAKKGLGKGLNSLFNEEDIEEVTSEITKSSEGDIKKVRMSLIEPNKKQPRRHFDEEKITALADSIKEHGLIQPIIITPSDNNMYKIVAGERRWRAAKIAGLKKITIREEKPEKLPVYADIDMLKTVIRNLLSNAIKFSNENSEVLVKMEEQGDMVVVSVKDNGCGIDEEGQKKLLHTDTHFSTFGTNNEEGSGLGLLLCQDFVVKNGGKLWFTSKQGEGSTFYFSIPLKK